MNERQCEDGRERGAWSLGRESDETTRPRTTRLPTRDNGPQITKIEALKTSIDDAWRANGLEHPSERRDRIAGIFFYLTDRTNCVVRLGLFFDGNLGTGAQVLAQAPAGSGERRRLRGQIA